MLVESAIKQHMAATEALIAFLDEIDGDSDFELCITDQPHDEDTDTEQVCEDEGGQCDDYDEPPAHPETCGGTFGAR